MKAARRSLEWLLTSEREEKLRNFTIPAEAEFVRAAFFRNWIRSEETEPEREREREKRRRERENGGEMAMIRFVKYPAYCFVCDAYKALN